MVKPGMMRILIVIAFVFSVAAVQAHTPLTSHLLNDSNALQKKWSVSMYSGVMAGTAWNSGRTSFLAPAIGLQLNRRLNNNLYAFAAVSTGPPFFYSGQAYTHLDYHNNFMTTPAFNSNQWGINTGIQAGLMYVNDAKTFSISGSIGVSNGTYPFRPMTQKQSRVGTSQ